MFQAVARRLALNGSRRQPHRIWPLLVLVATGTGWGLTIALATIATATGRHPLAVTFWSAVVSFAVLTAWLVLRRSRPRFDPDHIRFYVVAGLLGTVVPHVLSFYAAIHLPAGLRAAVFALTPMITLALSLSLALERPSLRRFVGLSLGVAAIALLFRPDVGGALSQHAFWVLVSLAAAASYAVENVFIALRRPAGLEPMTALWGMTLAAVIVLAGAVALTGTDLELDRPWGRAEAAIGLMAAIHVGCYAAFIFLIGRAGSVFASQVSYVVAPAGVVWGVVLLAEALSPTTLASTALVVAGLALIRPQGR